MRIYQVCTLFLVAFISLQSLLTVVHCLSQNGSINVPHSANAPIVDGQWTTSTEWQNASKYILTDENNHTAVLGTISNGTHLFILLDFLSDQSASSADDAWTYFDTKSNGGNLPDQGDYVFDATGLRQGNGTGTGGNNWVYITAPNGAKMMTGFSSLNDPYDNTTLHETYEFQLPCGFLGIGYSYGFYAVVMDSSTHVILSWPAQAADPNNPSVWGELSSESQFIPEWPGVISTALLVPITILVVMLHKKVKVR